MSTTTHPARSQNSSTKKQQANTGAAKASRQQNTVRRATVSLSADSSEIVERFKAATGMSTSRAIEELILCSEPRAPQIKMMDGLAIFDFPVKGDKITLEDIRRLEDEPW